MVESILIERGSTAGDVRQDTSLKRRLTAAKPHPSIPSHIVRKEAQLGHTNLLGDISGITINKYIGSTDKDY